MLHQSVKNDFEGDMSRRQQPGRRVLGRKKTLRFEPSTVGLASKPGVQYTYTNINTNDSNTNSNTNINSKDK